MTTNQLRYHELRETQRANREQESQGRSKITETNRSNLANETIKQGELMVKQLEADIKNRALSETERHNKEQELQNLRDLLMREDMHELEKYLKSTQATKNIADSASGILKGIGSLI